MNKLPDISVIVPVFNGEKYIGRCLRSLLSQTMEQTEFEIIVVNDCSSDNTSTILAKYSENIRIINHEANKGLPSSLNTGIKAAQGHFIIRVDSDDYVHSEYLNILRMMLNMNPDFDAVASDYLVVNDREEVLKRENSDLNPIGCAIMFRLEQLIDVGLYNEEFLLHEDKELRLRFESKYKVTRVPLPLYRYRKHSDNITNNTSGMNEYYNKLKLKYKDGE